jgi:hypothetical protein
MRFDCFNCETTKLGIIGLKDNITLFQIGKEIGWVLNPTTRLKNAVFGLKNNEIKLIAGSVETPTRDLNGKWYYVSDVLRSGEIVYAADLN